MCSTYVHVNNIGIISYFVISLRKNKYLLMIYKTEPTTVSREVFMYVCTWQMGKVDG